MTGGTSQRGEVVNGARSAVDAQVVGDRHELVALRHDVCQSREIDRRHSRPQAQLQIVVRVIGREPQPDEFPAKDGRRLAFAAVPWATSEDPHQLRPVRVDVRRRRPHQQVRSAQIVGFDEIMQLKVVKGLGYRIAVGGRRAMSTIRPASARSCRTSSLSPSRTACGRIRAMLSQTEERA